MIKRCISIAFLIMLAGCASGTPKLPKRVVGDATLRTTSSAQASAAVSQTPVSAPIVPKETPQKE